MNMLNKRKKIRRILQNIEKILDERIYSNQIYLDAKIEIDNNDVENIDKEQLNT